MTRTIEQITADRAALDRELQDALRAETRALLAHVARVAEKRGITLTAMLAELAGKRATSKRQSKRARRGVEPPRYISPNDPSVTWSGRGPRPAWFEAALRDGFHESELRIDREAAE